MDECDCFFDAVWDEVDKDEEEEVDGEDGDDDAGNFVFVIGFTILLLFFLLGLTVPNQLIIKIKQTGQSSLFQATQHK